MKAEYGISYPGLINVVRHSDREVAEKIAPSCPGAVVVARWVGEWLEVE
jgi:hypothetical protein